MRDVVIGWKWYFSTYALNRYVRYVLRWILHSDDRPFGRVKGYFARYEFQSGTGRGNKPHVHMGLICDPDLPEQSRPDNVTDSEWDWMCRDREWKNRVLRQTRVSCHEGDLWNRTDFGSEGTSALGI